MSKDNYPLNTEPMQFRQDKAGPVGGAGELTVMKVGDEVYLKARVVEIVEPNHRGIGVAVIVNARGTVELPLWVDFVALAAKAPQGVSAYVPADCPYCAALWELDQETMKHRHPSVSGFGAFAYPCEPAPERKLPAPVSDDTIHHGPFPPAKTATLLQELRDVPIRFGLEAQGHIPLVERMLAKRKSWDEIGEAINWHGPMAAKFYKMYLDREAAAPKPAPHKGGKQ